MSYGLDISSALSLLVQLDRKGAGYALRNVAVLPGFSPGTEEKPETNQKAAIGTSWQTLGSQGFRAGKPVTLIPGRDIVYRVVVVGSPNPKTIAPLVRLEADEIGGGQGGILGDYMLGAAPDGQPAAIIGLARDAIVDHYANSLRAAGIPFTTLVPGCAALYNAYQIAGDVSYEGTLLVANIGDDVTDVIIVKEGSLIFARTLSVGVRDFVDRLLPEYGGERDQVRARLFRDLDLRPSVAADNIASDRGVEGGQEAAGRLFQQINSVIMLAKGAHSDPKLDASRVMICGPGAAIPGLRELMMHRLRKTVEVFNPLNDVDLANLDEKAKQTVENYRPALTLAMGLAKIGADANAPKIVFLPSSVRRRREFMNKSLFLYMAAALVLAVLLPVFLLSRKAADEANANSRNYQGIVGRYQGASNQIPGRMEALTMARRKADASMYATAPGNLATRLLMEISATRPDSVRIYSADLKHPKKEGKDNDDPKILPPPPELKLRLFIQKTGNADPLNVIPDLRKLIKDMPGVLEVVHGEAKENSQVAGVDIEFTIKLKLEREFRP
ncbi:MAG: pilus assembly protein PilM [Planctomycetes bacterium]|nr:pilus assembly protein PilM [Planctomycetota bacterium]